MRQPLKSAIDKIGSRAPGGSVLLTDEEATAVIDMETGRRLLKETIKVILEMTDVKRPCANHKTIELLREAMLMVEALEN